MTARPFTPASGSSCCTVCSRWLTRRPPRAQAAGTRSTTEVPRPGSDQRLDVAAHGIHAAAHGLADAQPVGPGLVDHESLAGVDDHHAHVGVGTEHDDLGVVDARVLEHVDEALLGGEPECGRASRVETRRPRRGLRSPPRRVRGCGTPRSLRRAGCAAIRCGHGSRRRARSSESHSSPMSTSRSRSTCCRRAGLSGPGGAAAIAARWPSTVSCMTAAALASMR